MYSQPAPKPAAEAPKPAAKKPYKKANKGLTSLIDTVDEAINDTSDIILTDEAEEEENLYTDTLIKMLKLSAVQAVLSEQALEQVQAVKLAEHEQKQAGLQVQSLKCPRVPE